MDDAKLANLFIEKVSDISEALGSQLWMEVRITNGADDLEKSLEAIRSGEVYHEWQPIY